MFCILKISPAQHHSLNCTNYYSHISAYQSAWVFFHFFRMFQPAFRLHLLGRNDLLQWFSKSGSKPKKQPLLLFEFPIPVIVTDLDNLLNSLKLYGENGEEELQKVPKFCCQSNGEQFSSKWGFNYTVFDMQLLVGIHPL